MSQAMTSALVSNCEPRSNRYLKLSIASFLVESLYESTGLLRLVGEYHSAATATFHEWSGFFVNAMNYALFAGLLSLGLFLGMLVLLEVGRRSAIAHLARDPESANAGFAPIEAAVLGLLGLLLAFTITGAGARFDERRHLIVEETNAIGTAYLRLDVLSVQARLALQQSLRRYLDSRIEMYGNLSDTAAAKEHLAKSIRLQEEIWRQAVAGLREEGVAPQGTTVLLPALNAMIDITTTRTMAMQLHPPTVIFIVLFALALVSALLSGYGMAAGKSRSWLHMLSFAFIISVAVYVILDLEYPRLGFLRVDRFDQALVDLRKQIAE